MKIRIILCLISVIGSVLLLSSCNSSESGKQIYMNTSELLTTVLENASSSLSENSPMPPSQPGGPEAITIENCQSLLGMTTDDFQKYVDDAYVSNSLITAFAHEIAIIKCKDKNSAAQVKSLIASGFDTGKWICVRPEKCLTVESGIFVLFSATRANVCDAVFENFKLHSGESIGTEDIFYTSDLETENKGGGMGIEIAPDFILP